MGPSEAQGRLILARGWIPREQLTASYHEARAHNLDLLSFLERRGQLNPAQLEEIRRAMLAEGLGTSPDPAALLTQSARNQAALFNSARAPDPRGYGAQTAAPREPSPQAFDQSPPGTPLPQPLTAPTSPKDTRVDSRDSRGSRDSREASSNDPASRWLPGSKLGDYVIVEELSRGGMGLVLRARQVKDGSAAAIKVMLSSDPKDETRRRFERELRALSQIEHRNIVRVLSSGELDGLPWFAMELIEGINLRDEVEAIFERGEVTEPEWVRELIGDIAEALAWCHERGLVHRDVKPENLLIEHSTGRAVLVDFGLIKRDESRQDSDTPGLNMTRTVTREMVGTPTYMSPEQIDPNGEFGAVGDRSDVWALAATTFFALTGKAPFEADSMAGLISRIVSTPAPPLNSLRKDLPRWLSDLVAASMIRKAQRRPTMSEFADRLRSGPPSLAARLRRRLPIAVAALCSAATVLVLGFFSYQYLRAPARLIQIDFAEAKRLSPTEAPETAKEPNPPDLIPTTIVTQKLPLNIEMKFDRSCSGIKVAGRSYSTDGAGRLKVSIEKLSNPIEIQCPGAAPQQWPVIVDQSPPVTELKGRNLAELWIVDDTLRGRVKDESPVELTRDGRKLELDGDGGFALQLTPEAIIESFEITARDASGRSTTLRGRVARRAQLMAEARRLLSDINLWIKTKGKEQDLAIIAASVALGKNFEHASTRSYAVGGAEQKGLRIATFLHKPSKQKFQLIPGGRYQMGSANPDAEMTFIRENTSYTSQEIDERVITEIPQHLVTLKPFLIARTELSQEDWIRLGGEPPSSERGDDLPIHSLSRDQIRKWLKALRDGIRLPSETEWEYACRAMTTTRFFWGEHVDYNYSWSGYNSGKRIHSVEEHFKAKLWNAFGLVDITGNVWEWTDDDSAPNYSDTPRDNRPNRRQVEWVDLAIKRGGGATSNLHWLRSAARSYARPDDGSELNGFRLACSLELE